MNAKYCFIILALFFTSSISAQLPTDSIEILYDGNYGLSIVKNPSNEKFGVIDSIGNYVLPPKYEYIYPFYEELALVYDNDRCGFINLEGKVEIPIEYIAGNHFKNGKAIVIDKFISGVIDKSNNIVIPFKYESLQTNDHTSYSFQLESGKSGLMDSQEKIILEPIYDDMRRKNDSFWLVRINKKFTILKNNGDLHCPVEFDRINKIKNAKLFRFVVDKKIGFLDEQFNILIPAQYKNSGPIIGPLIAVSNGEKWGFIDRSNTSKTAFIYDKVKALNEENCIVIRDGMSNIIDKNANLRLDETYNYIQPISGSDLIFMDDHLYDSALNKKTNDVIRLTGDRFSGMENGMLKVRVDSKLGYVDALGEMKITPEYEDGDHFYEGNCTAVKKDEKWGFINNNNEPITAMTYDVVSHFGSFQKCNYLIVKDDLYGYFSRDKVIFEPEFQELIVDDDGGLIYREGDKFGIIDMRNFEIGQPIYDEIKAHLLGYNVKKEDKFGFIDKSLNIAVPIKYEFLDHSGFYLIAKLNGKFGTISEANEIIQDFIYDKIERIPHGFKRTYKDGKIGTLSSDGKELLPPIYDNINAIDWCTIEVSIDGKSENINVAKLETQNETKK